MSVQLAAQDFATPDKGGPIKMPATAYPTSSSSSNNAVSTVTPVGSESGSSDKNAVTPGTSLTTPSTNTGGKHVRFGAQGAESKDGESPVNATTTSNPSSTTSTNKRGLVSRRGGRYVSPGRPPVVTSGGNGLHAPAPQDSSDVVECKTYRSPPADSDSSPVPAISASNSVGIVSMPSDCEKDKETPQRSDVKSKLEEFEGNTQGGETAARPSTISCTSTIGPTSPLARTSTQKENCSFEVRSPVPSTSSDRFKKTPTKSPNHFHSLPSLDDHKLGSPVGFMLSPGPGTPCKTMHDSLDKEGKRDKSLGEKIRDYTKEKFVLTPTNFSTDYGKAHTTFDTSNVLNWLQSPTGNGLFSPGGGLNSIMNTPRGPLVPRTPGTPTVSTSFFFSDVASLARNGDTPKQGDAESGKSPKKGLSNIICISPLASTRHRHGSAHTAKSPINYHDIFASPNPLLDDSPVNGMGKRFDSGQAGKIDPSIDALTLAERDLMQDEDLSVLLQLAGGNTPKALAGRHSKSNSPSGRVFRPAGSRKGDDPHDRENLPGLQLPVIGDREGDSSGARLSRKTHSREMGESDGFVKATISIRNSTSASHENGISSNAGGPTDKHHPGMAFSSSTVKHTDSTSNDDEAKAPASSGAQPYPAHSMPPRPYTHRPSTDLYGYQAFPPNGMRPAGRMSVIVGGPPPSTRTPKPNHAPRSHMTHRRPSYAHGDYPPPGMPTYPPPGHYHHAVHMGALSYPNQYSAPSHPQPPPPPRSMPMYSSQQPQPHAAGKTTPTKSKPKPSPKVTKQALPTKRPSLGNNSAEKPPPSKKPRKSPGSKKGKSPQLTEKEDRQRAAQTIAAVNAASGGKNDKAAALAAAILRGVTMRPSGKWQAQLYFAGKSRYIGVFDTREKAALAYEIAREKLKSEKSAVDGALSPKQTENAVNAARKAAFDGVNEKDPRLTG